MHLQKKLCVFICIYIYAMQQKTRCGLYMYMHFNICMSVSVYAFLCEYVYINVHTFIHTRNSVEDKAWAPDHISMYIYIFIFIRIHGIFIQLLDIYV